ncbi:coiled-coil domain-containing protein 24-like [Haliotis rufescens]|uniref:coiled-coil domain-containing protein 24-like n=1 Tax=Haliotis rufescens TaxID=6454 RepID=UPI001EB0A209|nr:coiled-coil domain-containing protein 24-like [Haliotis rufescens]XP_046340644.1 coiled-coil domain-containing protein 24-like [Haliotis rufescens]
MASKSVPTLELSTGRQGYQPPLSLWQLVEELVSSHEQEEIKRILGESLIDQSIELHEEVSTLMSIWHDYKMETRESEPPKPLPEPPQQRERLIQEISFFVANVKDKANSTGIDHEHLFSSHNSCVIEYVLETSRHCSNAHLRSPVTDETTSRVISPQNSIPFQDLGEEMLRMRNKLNYLQLDDVVQHLRLSLQDEIEQLLQDITFLQHQIDDEVSIRMTGRPTIAKEPTLTELKEERAALEKELLTHATVPASLPNRPTFVPKPHFRLQSTSTMACPSQPIKKAGKVLFSSRDCKWKNIPGIPVKAQYEENSNAGVACSSASPDCGTSSPVSLRDITVLDRPIRKRSVSPSRVKVIPVDRLPSPQASPLSEAKYIPTPPTKQVVNRPSSADRFRKLVLDCRDGP